MFEVEGDTLELRFNMQKVKTIEAMQKISLMSELSQSRGLLSFHLLEALFVNGLFNKTQEKNVAGKKAQEIYNDILGQEGYGNLNAIVIGKLEEDLGFLFR